MTVQRADWVLIPEAQAPAHARSLIASKLRDLPLETVDVVLLLASELVTNAVRHGSGPVRLHVAWGDGAVRVEVEDRSPRWPVVEAMDRDALRGRGLILVDGLSSGWGVRALDIGKTVWFTTDE